MDVGHLHCRHGSDLPVERRELDLVCLAIRVHVNDRADVPGFQAFCSHRGSQDDPIKFS